MPVIQSAQLQRVLQSEAVCLCEKRSDLPQKEKVERIVIGMPTNLDMSDTHTTVPVRKFILKLEQQFPGLPISMIDERFTSKMAMQTMIMGGMKKKDRREKSNVDKISASLILQSFLANPGT